MELKDKNGITRIKFSDFRKHYDSIPVFIDLFVEINTINSYTIENISVELTDIQELITNLKTLIKELKWSFDFHHIDEQLQIKFEPSLTGIIYVTGFLKDKLYKNVVNFSFETYPIEASNFVRSGENLLDVIS